MKLSLSVLLLCPLFIRANPDNDFIREYTPTSNVIERRIEMKATNKLVIQDDHKLTFKTTERHQSVEFIAASNVMSFNGDTYSLNNVKEYSIWAPDSKVYLDGNDLNPPRQGRALEGIKNQPVFYFGKVGKVELLIVQNHLTRRIEAIETHDTSSSVTKFIFNSTMSIAELDNRNSPDLEEYAFNFSKSYLQNDTIEYWTQEGKLNETDNSLFQAQGSCGVYRQIDVAIAFDSSFCKFMGGFNAAVQRVQYIVALASNKFKQQGLCLSLKLKAVDGRCKGNDDPYKKMMYWKSGCLTNKGLYQDFTSYFRSNMKQIPRDAAHLFTARTMDGPIGCSGLGSLCGRFAYGVNQMSFTSDLTLQTSLFAHELAHNCGASHNNKNGYIMSLGVNDGRNGFTAQSIKQMLSYLSTVSCLAYSNN